MVVGLIDFHQLCRIIASFSRRVVFKNDQKMKILPPEKNLDPKIPPPPGKFKEWRRFFTASNQDGDSGKVGLNLTQTKQCNTS